ncbi:MAG TPA: uroporphyrinogen-III C-methyltransferase, partial [Tepidisphaeraceae bacterium]|nr:uroporphyrinogen-III C-methyltransferase [Tepidisphaeraceae bacterium]
MNAPKPSGIVYLVGAGPGDPGLLTLRGKELLEQADVVIYDYLANPRLLSYCPRAETIYAGKKSADHTLSQDQINQLLISHAKKGERVVRLKGGDPFIFGRGAEECAALHDAGIPFEIIPGITAAIAGPAYAGIPVTHRDFNSSFTLITGHEKEEETSDIDWSVISKLPCVAFYMGVKSLPKICENLIAHGMDRSTPAATIQWGTTPRQRTAIGTISDLPQRVADAGITAPAITIIGKVVTLRTVMNWFETRPLFGQTIAVTRTRQQSSDLATRLENLGANVIEAPTIELIEPNDWKEVDDALNRAASYDWIIFTSVNGVRAVRDRLRFRGNDSRIFGRAKIAAIGDATAAAIRDDLCLHVDLCPQNFVAEALADELASRNEIAGKRFLLLRADIARPILADRLRLSAAAQVNDV